MAKVTLYGSPGKVYTTKVGRRKGMGGSGG